MQLLYLIKNPNEIVAARLESTSYWVGEGEFFSTSDASPL
jgi:hypothetical protein